jgi:hypothetical protein
MQNNTTQSTSKPQLRERPTHPTILSIIPRPPEIHREVPAPHRVKSTLTAPAVRVKRTLYESVDYVKLTASQQARWDAGMYGSIELKGIRGNYYFYLRWLDPESRSYRSTYLSKDWDKAILKLKELTSAP